MSPSGHIPLLSACEDGNLHALTSVLTTDPSLVNIRDDHSLTPLMISADNAHTALIRHLLTVPGIDVTLKDKYSRDALHHALLADSPAAATAEIISAFLEAGADANGADGDGMTALMTACSRDKPEAVKVLVHWPGVDINRQDERLGRSALRWGVENGGDGASARMLVTEAGDRVDLEVKDKEGETALLAAMYRSMDSFGAFLLEKGADPNVMDAYCRQTPLWHASSNGLVETVRVLVKKEGAGISAVGLDAENSGCGGCGVGGILQALVPSFGSSSEGTHRPGTHLPDKYGNTPLHEACFHGHLYIVKMLLATGNADVNARDHCECTPLARAVQMGSMDIVKLLLDTEGVDFDAKDHLGNPLLSFAADNGKKEIVEMFLEKGIGGDINGCNKSGLSPLGGAATSGHADIVEILIKAGAKYNIKDEKGFTPLALAARDGHAPVVRALLLQRDIEVNATDISGRTALHWAISSNKFDTTQLLVADPRVDVTMLDDSRWSPILIASSKNHGDILSLLLKDGRGDVNARDEGGWSPLISAAANGHLEIVRQLLAVEGISVNENNLSGRSALTAAVCQGHGKVVELLLTNEDIDTNYTDFDKRTALSWAAEKGDSETVDALLKNKFTDISLEDDSGLTAIDYAQQEGHAAIVTKLAAAKAFH